MTEYLNLYRDPFLFHPTKSFLFLPMEHIYYVILSSQAYFLLVCKTPEIEKLWELFMTHFSIIIPIEMIWNYTHIVIFVSTWFRQDLFSCKKQEPAQANLN